VWATGVWLFLLVVLNTLSLSLWFLSFCFYWKVFISRHLWRDALLCTAVLVSCYFLSRLRTCRCIPFWPMGFMLEICNKCRGKNLTDHWELFHYREPWRCSVMCSVMTFVVVSFLRPVSFLYTEVHVLPKIREISAISFTLKKNSFFFRDSDILKMQMFI
jgi:hypothetical protein